MAALSGRWCLCAGAGAELAGPEGLPCVIFTTGPFFGSQIANGATECFKTFPRGMFRCAWTVAAKGMTMGFFSRLFKIKEQDPTSPDTTWAMEDNGSALVLDAEYAATLMTEIDIDAAIASHERWRLQLQDMVNGRSDEVMRPERICHDDRCDLGRWLYGTGRVRLGHYPAFEMLVARHKYFHQQAADVVTLFQSGEQQKAVQLLNSSCRHASNQVLLLLKELKRGLGR